MATTPSVGGPIHTPATPLHGAAYDSYEPYSARYQTRATSRKLQQPNETTPEPSSRAEVALSQQRKRLSTPPARFSSVHHFNRALSPPQTVRRSPRRKANNRVFPDSPTSPSTANMDEFAPTAPRGLDSSSHPFSSTTTMHEGMLPTPVKTPRKKPVANVQAAARALFQDQPLDLQEVAAAPSRSKKARRYNGFSLESFSAEGDGTGSNIQIFTDSRDRVPEMDASDDNPFLDHPRKRESTSSKKVAGISKRRKISGERKKDADVEEAIEKDEGMIYVL